MYFSAQMTPSYIFPNYYCISNAFFSGKKKTDQRQIVTVIAVTILAMTVSQDHT